MATTDDRSPATPRVADSWHGGRAEPEEVLRIDCAECVLEGTTACVDCVVTFLVRSEPGSAVVVDAAEVRALRALERGGLAPGLRHRRRQPV
jgi:hypothetical protein